MLLLASCTSGGDTARTPDEGARPTGAIPALDVAQPRVWGASASSWAITLSWQAPPDVSVDHYEVRRDDAPLADDLSDPTYRDTDVEPGATYTYSVVGLSADDVPTRPAVATVKAHAPAAQRRAPRGILPREDGGRVILRSHGRTERRIAHVRLRPRLRDGHLQHQVASALPRTVCPPRAPRWPLPRQGPRFVALARMHRGQHQRDDRRPDPGAGRGSRAGYLARDPRPRVRCTKPAKPRAAPRRPSPGPSKGVIQT